MSASQSIQTDTDLTPFKPLRNLVHERSLSRTICYPEDDLTADFITTDGKIERGFSVVDICSNGLGISKDHCDLDFAKFPRLRGVVYKKGKRVFGFSCQAVWTKPHKGRGLRIGLSMIKDNEAKHTLIDLDGHLGGETQKGFLGKSLCLFTVRGIWENVLKVEVADRTCVFFKNMKLKLRLHIPFSDNLIIQTSIENVLVSDGRQQLILRPICKKSYLQASLSNYLLNYCFINPQLLSGWGFPIVPIRNITYRFVDSHEDYLEVLSLRDRAYKHAGKIARNQKITEMSCSTDEKSRILMILHGDKLVASVAMAFPDEKTIMDTEVSLKKGFPHWIPPKEQMVEISRLCCAPEYKGSGLFWVTIKEIERVALGSQRRFVITSAEGSLLSCYIALGFQRTSLKYAHHALSGKEHEIITLNMEKTKTVSPMSKKNFFLYRIRLALQKMFLSLK